MHQLGEDGRFLIKSWMFLELFLSAKKMKFLTKGVIHCISRLFGGTLVIGLITESLEFVQDT